MIIAIYSQQNSIKLSEVRNFADLRDEQKLSEQTRIIENKLFVAEQNREREIQKKLDNIRKHVGLFFISKIFSSFQLMFCLVSSKINSIIYFPFV
jgi:hypothetical protein